MTLPYPQAAEAIADALYRRTVRRADGTTERCGLSVRRGGGDTEASNRVEAERGAYVLRLPADTTLRLEAGETVTIDEEPGRMWRVVWTPPMGNLALSRQYGLDEVR